MTPKTLRNTLLWFLLLSFSHATAETFEVRLRRDPVRSPGVVRLGHIADLRRLPSQRRRELESIDICPAPGTGDRLVITRDQIRRLLVLQGVAGRALKFTGPEQVIVRGDAGPARPVRAMEAVALRVEQAIASQWNGQGREFDSEIKLVKADLPDFLQRYELVDVEPLAVDVSAANTDPMIRSYRLAFARDYDGSPFSVSVTARMEPVTTVVVSARALRRGDIISAQDVRLVRLGLEDSGVRPAVAEHVVRRIEEVVGMEVQQTLAAGKPIEARSLKPPIVIRRREAVDLVARVDGITVRTLATALEDAHVGELVRLENPETKERLVARAIGPHQAEIRLGGQRPATKPKGKRGKP